jgi:HEAT repeat protein
MRTQRLKFSLVMVGLLSVAGATPGSPHSSSLDKLRGVLARPSGDTRTREQVVEQMVRLGPNAIPELFGTYTGANIEALIGTDKFIADRWWCAPDEFGGLSLEALGDMPAKKLVTFLKRQTQANPPTEIKLACMRVLGKLGSAQGLPLLFNTASKEGAKALRYRSVASAFEQALGDILSNDRQAFAVLESRVNELAPELLTLAIEATRRADRPEGVAFLLSVLGQTVELDIASLEASADLARRFPWRVTVDPRRQMRERLRDQSALVRRAAAIATGRIHDTEAFELLVLMLADPDPQVVRAAEWSLCLMTGESQLDTAEEWRRWHELEDKWWSTEGARLRLELEADDPRRVTAAAGRLSRRPFQRDLVALYICDVLPQQVPAAVADLCGVLAQIESSSAVPTLVDLLFDKNARVRSGAGSALMKITGRSLPPEPWIWEKYANG